ncbi:CorA metal ion transporter [Dipsacomyces acuminosporus]|nr:CorA metal ion transporter [Dipsacomyces acuminosporus]
MDGHGDQFLHQKRHHAQAQIRPSLPGLRQRTGFLRTTNNAPASNSSSMAGNMNGLPTLDHGGSAGFNGIVFGSGGSELGGTPSILHHSGLGSRLAYDGAVAHEHIGLSSHHRLTDNAADQLNSLHEETLALRRDNQALLAANEARQRVALRLLREAIDSDDEHAGDNKRSDDSVGRRKQLAKLLLMSLDASASSGSGETQQIITGFDKADKEPSLEAIQSPTSPPTYSEPSVDVQPRPRQFAQNARHKGWNSSILAEISKQGAVAEDDACGDRYASESRRAFGPRLATAGGCGGQIYGRRKSQVDRKSLSTASSKSSSPSIDNSRQEVSHPGSFPDDTAVSSPLSKLEKQNAIQDHDGFARESSQFGRVGSLAASLLGSNPDGQFVQQDSSRFVLYSPSAGTFQSSSLDGLRSGDYTLADIVEASRRSISLGQLGKSSTSEDAQVLKEIPSPPLDAMDALHITPTSTRKNANATSPAMPAETFSAAATGCFWLDVTDPAPDEMYSLARVFGIHPLTVEDIVADEDGRDKFESFGDYTFIVYRTIDHSDDAQSNYEFNRGSEGVATTSFFIILKQSCILTFHHARKLDHLPSVLGRLADLATPGNTEAPMAHPSPVTPAYIAYALVDDITDALGPEIRGIELEVDAVDELVLILSPNEQADMLQRIGTSRRKILAIWRLLQGKPEVIRAFSKLMEKQAQIDELLWYELEEEQALKKLDASHLANKKNGAQSLFEGKAKDMRSKPSSMPVSPHQSLQRSTYSTTALSQLAAAGAARQKNASAVWHPRPSSGLGIRQRGGDALQSAHPSSADLASVASGAAGGVVGREAEGPITAGEVAHYLSDVYDHLASFIGSSSHCDMVLSRAHSNYLARVSLELGESTVNTSLFASRWTVIGAILLPLNVITSLFGMNVKVPGQDRNDTRDFFLILAGCLAFVVVVMTWAKYKRIF